VASAAAAGHDAALPAQPPRTLVTRAIDAVDVCARAVLVVALLGELALVMLDVAARAAGHTGFLWVDEVARFALSTMTFVGGAVAYRRREHSPVLAVVNRLPAAWRSPLAALDEWFVLLTACVAGLSSLTLIETSWVERTPILALPAATIAMPLTACAALLALYALERLWNEHGRRALVVALPLLVLAVLLSTTYDTWTDWLPDAGAIALTLALFLLAVVIGVPVGFALILAPAAYLWVSDGAPMVALAQNMVNGTANYVLLAIPFFVVAGLVMERGGLSRRLVHFIHALVGHFRGGMLQVMVISMYFVSGLSGSKSADVAAVGSVMRDMLRRERYDLAESTAALAAAAAMGETIPPSIAMLILGSVTSVSIAAMFVGGLIPAAVIALCLMALIYIDARRANAPRQAGAGLREILRAGLHAILPLLMPVLLFAGILLGFATPTEISSFAVLYGLALAILVYREIGLADVLRIVVDGATLTGMILFILAAASAFSWVLTIANLPTELVDALHALHASSAIFMIGTIVLLILVGSLLEGLAALNVMAPLLMPLTPALGINPLHYGMVLIIAMGVGAFMPPAGVGFYVCCAVMRTDIGRASRAMLPYFLVLIGGLLIVAFVPWLSLVLPRLFHFAV
jgi:tripartite ATP-independent transporter DctM subunit